MSPGFTVHLSDPEGSRAKHVFAVEVLQVGRDEGCDLVLPSMAVSRFHMRVEQESDRLRIVDASSNGTFVDGRRVHSSAASCAPKTPIGVGPYTLSIACGQDIEQGAPLTPEERRRIHRELLDHLDLASIDRSGVDDSALRARVVSALEQIVSRYEGRLSDPMARARLVAEMTDEVLGLGPLQRLLEDQGVTEVMVVDPDTIYVERNGRLELTPHNFTDEEACRAAIERIVTPLGRRIDESTPLVDARLPDGSRVNAIIPPLALRGPCITIRKFPKRPLEMHQLVELGALDDSMAVFLRRCVRAKKNMLISGGTGSGKTTLLNVLATEIASEERIVTIEDAAELRLVQPHVVSLESKPTNIEGRGEYTIRDLLKNALRMRPDRILVGECRSGEAIDMLQAMNTGHEGSMTTTHANSAREALKRVETLCMMAGLDLSTAAVREQMAASLHVVLQQTRFSDGTRKITSISEVGGLGYDGELLLYEIFSFHRTGTAQDGAVHGEHRPTGHVPSFLDEFISQGLVSDGEYL